MATPSISLTEDKYIGKGAYGSVYRQRDKETGEFVAVKRIVVENEDANVTKELKAVNDEIDMMKDLHHKRIVQYIRAEQESNIFSIYMEYLDGGSVADELGKNGPLSEDTTKKYTLQLLEGLSYLHGKRIIHRDVKGSNILCDGKGNIKLADFGISRQMNELHTMKTKASKHTATKGTIYWMAPEVIKGAKYGRRADIWSTGATVVEMLTTQPPWHGLGEYPAMYKISNMVEGGYVLDSKISSDANDFLAVIFTTEEQRPRTDGLLQHSWLKAVYDTPGEPPKSKYPRLDGDQQPSDDEGLSSPAKPDLSYLPLVPTTLPGIRNLFMNTGKVYPMSKPCRGRALVINIQTFANMTDRKGSDVDQLNLVNLLKRLQFDVVQKQEVTTEVIYSTIKTEIAHPDHKDYGMFMLVLMSHGSEDGIVCGSDGKGLKLQHVYDLMSPQNFGNMSGKPKVLIIQACSGDKYVPESSTGDRELYEPDIQPVQQIPQAILKMLNVDDLVILKSSFESYASMRHDRFGSLFVRTLVTTLYKHACHRDVVDLFDIVRERVREASMKIAKDDTDYAYGQIPVAINTLTSYRKLYLFPGYNGEK